MPPSSRRPDAESDHRKIRPQIEVTPTLAAMADVYRLPREGGAASPRFKRYLELIPGTRALAAFNPMAGPHALETTEQLLEVDAEAIVLEAAREAANLCEYPDAIILSVVLCAPGMWTSRLSTEIEHRTTRRPPPGHGVVLHWTRETPTAEQVRREAIAETVRVMAIATRARADSVASLVHREGLAYALGGSPYGPFTSEDERAVADALEVLGESRELSDMTAVLYGDPAAVALGWAPAGVAEHGGYRWGIDQAERRLEAVGAPAALRAIAAS